ncbi:hypothetical protein HDU99_002713, partial [Rhizoclosmatium hyalinum]
TLKPGDAVVDWWISAFHMGGCVVEISRDGGTTWSYIGGDARCGDKTVAGPGLDGQGGTGHIPVVIPAVSGAGESYKAVIRWYYTANNGGSPDEEFASCSDVVVANNGNNEHTFHVKVPQSPWQYQQTGCEAGALMCSDDSAFINQCISLAKSGTWGGGSAWYAYQCPEGTTCKNNNCVGNPVAASTIVAKPSLTYVSSTIVPVTSSLVLSTKASTTIPAVPISTIVAKVSTNAVSSTQVVTSIATTTPVSTSLNAIKTAAVSSTSKPTSTVPTSQVTSTLAKAASSSTIVKVNSSTIVKDTSSTVAKASSSTITKVFSSTTVAKAASSSVATTVGKGTTATTSSAPATITKPATGSIKNAALLAPLKSTATHVLKIKSKMNQLSATLQNPSNNSKEKVEKNTIVLTPEAQEILATSFPVFLASVASCADSIAAIQDASKPHKDTLASIDDIVDKIAVLSRESSK